MTLHNTKKLHTTNTTIKMFLGDIWPEPSSNSRQQKQLIIKEDKLNHICGPISKQLLGESELSVVFLTVSVDEICAYFTLTQYRASKPREFMT